MRKRSEYIQRPPWMPGAPSLKGTRGLRLAAGLRSMARRATTRCTRGLSLVMSLLLALLLALGVALLLALRLSQRSLGCISSPSFTSRT